MKKESKIKILLPILAVIIVTVLIFNRLLFKLKDQVDKVALPIQSKVYNVANRAISLKNTWRKWKTIKTFRNEGK